MDVQIAYVMSRQRFTKSLFSARIGLMTRLTFCLILILVAAFVAIAQQRPLLTDDVDITPPGALEIGAGVDFFQNAKFPLSGIKGDLT